MLAALIVFLSAFLLFALQPLLGRQMLPFVGGAAGGWLVILAFFQVALVCGYAVAHYAKILTPRLQSAGVCALLALGLVNLPPQFAGDESLTGSVAVLLRLIWSAAFVALGLSLISTSVQRHVAATGRPPYALYAASNAGSLLGLLAYPLLAEPLLTTAQQQAAWSAGYVALLAALMLFVWRTPAAGTGMAAVWAGWPQRLRWLVLAAVPASLSYGLTAYVSMELGSFPLYWVVPLALYLLSYIIAFGQNRLPQKLLNGVALGALAVVLGLVAVAMAGHELPLALFLFLFSLLFFLLATAVHVRLAAARPAPEALSEYYLWLAVGGALGGLFNVFVAPFVFSYPIEFFFAALLAACLLPVAPGFDKALRRLAAVAVFLLVGINWLMATQQETRLERNFFGVALVYDADDVNGHATRYLTTGVGLQGSQRREPYIETTPQLYFTVLQSLFAARPLPRVGMLGLGAGMALCFNTPPRHFTVYEIDPKIRRIAERDFTYIRSCGAPDWRMGDGRVELQRDTDKQFDILLVDAFQGVNIPLHLLTREAFALYRARLAPQGLLLYNTNSVYYDLTPQILVQAKEAGWQVWQAPSSWLLLAQGGQDLRWLAALGWKPLEKAPDVRVWSDHWASPLSALR